MNFHIHAPPPTNIYPVESGMVDRFNRVLNFCNRCNKRRIIENLEMVGYEWYEPLIRCKVGKGCRIKEGI